LVSISASASQPGRINPIYLGMLAHLCTPGLLLASGLRLACGGEPGGRARDEGALRQALPQSKRERAPQAVRRLVNVSAIRLVAGNLARPLHSCRSPRG